VMSRIIALGATLCLGTGELAAQGQLSGDWRGHWLRAADTMPITLHLKRDPATQAYTASFDSDRLRVMGIPFARVSVDGCCKVVMQLQGDRTTTVFTGTLRGDTLSGEFDEQGSEGRFVFSRATGRSAPLTEREVTFRNGDVSLAGSLILPPDTGRHPAVVFVHGSGAEGRWASRFLAVKFAEQGVAALIFDKRGVGKSSGDWPAATLDDLAGDAAGAVAYLRQQPQIDARRIGVHGHSQGGTLAPMIAVRSPDVAFLIVSAAAGVPTDSTELFSILNSIYPNAATSTDSADARAYASEVVDVAYHGKARVRLDALASQFRGRPWYFAPPEPDASYWSFSKLFGEFRPLDWWRQVRVPVLLIYGAEDQRVPARESAARIAAELVRQTPRADVTVRILPDADHTFRLPPGPSGWPATAPDYLPTLVNWLRDRR
jgi:dipeptidyl aminopeptidase/acylaminoacyl peptidase